MADKPEGPSDQGMAPLFDLVLKHVPAPKVDTGPFRMIGTLLLAFQRLEEAARLVLRRHNAECADDRNDEQKKIEAQHPIRLVRPAFRPRALRRCARADYQRLPRHPP